VGVEKEGHRLQLDILLCAAAAQFLFLEFEL